MKRLWLIDDDPIFRFVFNHIMQSSDTEREFVAYENGQLAFDDLVQRIRTQEAPDVILLDINMPVLNGWGFLENLKQLDHDTSQIKVYLISSSVAQIDQDRSKHYPALNGYINKPINAEQINALL